MARKYISNKLIIFESDRNSGIPPFVGKRSCLKRIKGYDTGEEGGASRQDISSKLMIFGSERKETVEFCRSMERDHVWKETGVMTLGRREVKAGTLLLGNDKNNVIANEVLNYFKCLSSRFGVYVKCFGTK